MDIHDLIDPSTTLGAISLGVLSNAVVGVFGFFLGKKHEAKKNSISKSKIKGDKNTNIQNSTIRR